MRLNLNQRKIIADIIGNLAVAWISIFTITQLISKEKSIIFVLIGIISFFLLSLLSINVVK